MLRASRTVRIAAFSALLALAVPCHAEGLRLSANAGVGSAYDQMYYAIGGRLGYDLGFGLTPEVGVSWWAGAAPTFVRVAPGITWYLPVPLLRPYLGGFYAHDFVNGGLPDEDALGVRAGIGLLGAGPLSVGIGASYARRLSCAAACDTWWPEASATVAF